MPSSFPESFPVIVHVMEELRPKTILDIGPGIGKYGLASVEYLGVKADCLEIFPPYVTPVLKEIYANVLVGNALEYNIPQYDLYLIIDVIEHWPKEEAIKLVERLLAVGRVLISTPRSVGEQGAENGNEWERHISQWKDQDFEKYNPLKYHTAQSFIYVLRRERFN